MDVSVSQFYPADSIFLVDPVILCVVAAVGALVFALAAGATLVRGLEVFCWVLGVLCMVSVVLVGVAVNLTAAEWRQNRDASVRLLEQVQGHYGVTALSTDGRSVCFPGGPRTQELEASWVVEERATPTQEGLLVYDVQGDSCVVNLFRADGSAVVPARGARL